jgi:hypothetical protein
MASTPAPAPSPAPRRLACARCGKVFDCGLSAACWCAAEDFRVPMPAGKADDCLCPSCLRALAAEQAQASR